MEQERTELNLLREDRPSQLYPELERIQSRADPARSGLKKILTLLGGFIVCLSFGSGKFPTNQYSGNKNMN